MRVDEDTSWKGGEDLEGETWNQSVKLSKFSAGEDGLNGELEQVEESESNQESAASVEEQDMEVEVKEKLQIIS